MLTMWNNYFLVKQNYKIEDLASALENAIFNSGTIVYAPDGHGHLKGFTIYFNVEKTTRVKLPNINEVYLAVNIKDIICVE